MVAVCARMAPTMPMTKVDGHGRIVVPNELRRALGLRRDSLLDATLEEGRIVLTPQDDPWARLQALFEHARPESSVVEELIAERRAEGRREGG